MTIKWPPGPFFGARGAVSVLCPQVTDGLGKVAPGPLQRFRSSFLADSQQEKTETETETADRWQQPACCTVPEYPSSCPVWPARLCIFISARGTGHWITSAARGRCQSVPSEPSTGSSQSSNALLYFRLLHPVSPTPSFQNSPVCLLHYNSSALVCSVHHLSLTVSRTQAPNTQPATYLLACSRPLLISRLSPTFCCPT